ncbi:hypothetical protein Bbelb_048630 [Branchiostoma belcheri]|nr:hypothetical protein Bbelb_048630 [Branchiostoma belcheri]
MALLIRNLMDATREGDGERVARCLKMTLLFFRAYGHTKYALGLHSKIEASFEGFTASQWKQLVDNMDAKLHKSYVTADGCTTDALLRELQKIPKSYLANNNARVGNQVLGKIRVERPAFVSGFRPSLLTGLAQAPTKTTMGPMWAAKIAARVKAVAEKDLSRQQLLWTVCCWKSWVIRRALHYESRNI